jgi:bifunctional DNase/RNase
VVRELSVIGVRVELPTNQPIVLLREVDGDRYLPIWIGAVEATAIAYEQQGVKPARPLLPRSGIPLFASLHCRKTMGNH